MGIPGQAVGQHLSEIIRRNGPGEVLLQRSIGGIILKYPFRMSPSNSKEKFRLSSKGTRRVEFSNVLR